MGKVKDALGDRMKQYESSFKYKLPRRGYTMIRIDGKAFHTYTKGLQRPFDMGLIDDMDDTAKYLCENIQGAKCAFVQSDEITIVITDFDNINTSAWFDNSIQKMVSVSASMATSKFNQRRLIRYFSGDDLMNIALENDRGIGEHFEPGTNLEEVRDDISSFCNYLPLKWKLAEFDSRVWQVPTRGEVINNLIWRQQDTVKNSISSVAQTYFSHKELQGKNGNNKQEMLFTEKGINWNDFDPKLKRGRLIVKETYEKSPEVFRSRWVSVAPPIFTQDKSYLEEIIPNNI